MANILLQVTFAQNYIFEIYLFSNLASSHIGKLGAMDYIVL